MGFKRSGKGSQMLKFLEFSGWKDFKNISFPRSPWNVSFAPGQSHSTSCKQIATHRCTILVAVLGMTRGPVGWLVALHQAELQKKLEKQLQKHMPLEEGDIHGVSIAYNLSAHWAAPDLDDCRNGSCGFSTSYYFQAISKSSKSRRFRVSDTSTTCRTDLKCDTLPTRLSLRILLCEPKWRISWRTSPDKRRCLGVGDSWA